MTTHRIRALVFAALILFAGAVAGHSEDYYDHPEIGRYEGSSILHQESSAYDVYTLGSGAAQDGKITETLPLRGKLMMTLYRGPDDASSFQIVSAYRDLLESRGYEVLHTCEKTGCGEGFLAAYYDLAPFANDPGWDNSAPITQGNREFSYVLTARSDRGQGQTYVSLIVSQGWWSYPVYKLDVVEARERQGSISSTTGAGAEPGTASSASSPSRKLRIGLQASSDSYFGVVLYANRIELSVKAQSLVFDGFPANEKPDDVIMVGGHASFLFKPWATADLGVGLDVRQGIPLTGETVYRQYLDAGVRVSYNHHLGDRFMVSALLYPVWVSVRETEVADSFSLSARIPWVGISATFFF